MNAPPPQLDIVAVMIALASLLFGQELAAIVGPYVVIVLGALLGGVWSASRRPPSTMAGTVGYLVLIVLMALLFTVPAAEFVASYARAADARPFFAPVAAMIAGIGPDWPHVVRWFIALARAAIERRSGAPPPHEPPTGGTT